LTEAMSQLSNTVRDAVAATQQNGRHPEVSPEILTLFTNSVPIGVASALINPFFASSAGFEDLDEETLIEQVINLVVPLPTEAT